MTLPPDVPFGSSESRRLLREMGMGLLAMSSAEAPEIVKSTPPDGSAERRRLLKEAAATNKKMLEETSEVSRKMLEEARIASKHGFGTAPSPSVVLVTVPNDKGKKGKVTLPTDVPRGSSEGRRLNMEWKNKGLYSAPIKKVPFKPKFDGAPMGVHVAGRS